MTDIIIINQVHIALTGISITVECPSSINFVVLVDNGSQRDEGTLG